MSKLHSFKNMTQEVTSGTHPVLHITTQYSVHLQMWQSWVQPFLRLKGFKPASLTRTCLSQQLWMRLGKSPSIPVFEVDHWEESNVRAGKGSTEFQSLFPGFFCILRIQCKMHKKSLQHRLEPRIPLLQMSFLAETTLFFWAHDSDIFGCVAAQVQQQSWRVPPPNLASILVVRTFSFMGLQNSSPMYQLESYCQKCSGIGNL